MDRRLQSIREFALERMPNLPYHNPWHMDDMVRAALDLAQREGCSSYECHLLAGGGYVHDLVYVPGATDNEEQSVVMARPYLASLGYSPYEIDEESGLVLATKNPTHPKSKLEMIMCDADLDNLGRDDFFARCENLREEFKVEDRAQWYRQTLGFLENHKYYTASARALRGPGLEANIRAVRRLVGENNGAYRT